MRIGRSVAIAGAALLGYSTAVRAECWTPPPPCAAMKQNSVVVLVKVIGPKDLEDRSDGPWDDVRLQVLERFKGIASNQTEIDATIRGTPETIFLLKDQTYLVYANAYPSGGWSTQCSRTRQVTADDDDELRVLRQCRSDVAKGQP